MSAKTLYSFRFKNIIFETLDSAPDFPFFELKQVHGKKIVSPRDCKQELEQADAFIDSTLSKTLCIKTADCLPVALIGENAHALLHAGWRGLQKNILGQEKLLEISPSLAIIGPFIKKFEVTQEMKAHFEKKYFYQENNRLHLDLGKIAKDQLLALSPSITIEESPLCSLSTLSIHSYRRDQTSKRNYNILKVECLNS